MKTYQQKLFDRLEIEGWEITVRYEENVEWWADEIWEISSTFGPLGKQAFVTLLVDPQHDGVRRKGESIWAFGVNSKYPTSRIEAQGKATCPLNKMFKIEIEKFIDCLDRIRW